MMRPRTPVAALLGLALLSGCADRPATQTATATSVSPAAVTTPVIPTPVIATSPTTADPASPEPTFAADCPKLPSAAAGSFAAVDFVDFLNANGQQYVGNTGQPSTVTSADRGALQFRVRCSFSELNDRTHQMTPQPRDGDAAFLRAGTPVYAVKGWSARCRLMAVAVDAWQLYVASPEPGSCKAMPASGVR